MLQYRVTATLQSTVEMSKIQTFFGPCLDFARAEEILVALARREDCLGATIVPVEVPDNEITIEDQPGPHAGTESQAPRFRITTNGEKFRVEKLTKSHVGPWGTIRIEPVEEWGQILVGQRVDYDTHSEATVIKDRLIKACDIAARPWVPVEGGS